VVWYAEMEQAWEDFLAEIDAAFRFFWRGRVPNFPLKLFAFAVTIEGIVERFLLRALRAPAAAVLETARQAFVDRIPAKWNTQVVSRRRAVEDALEIITSFIPQAASLQLPISLKLVSTITSFQSKLQILLGRLPGVLELLGKAFLRLVAFFVNAAFTLLYFAGVFIAIVVLWIFVRRMLTDSILRPLFQGTKRKKWYAHRGSPTGKHSIIRRRDPGGNPP